MAKNLAVREKSINFAPAKPLPRHVFKFDSCAGSPAIHKAAESEVP